MKISRRQNEKPKTTRRKRTRRLLVETLEDRLVPAPVTFPAQPSVYIQTSGPGRPPTIGDWYTTATSASTDHAHYVLVEVTPGMIAAGGGSVTITVNDAESTTGPGPNDEVANASDPTRFSLLAADRATVLSSTIEPSGTANGTNVVFTVNAAGTYYVKSEDGGIPISGDATAGLNDDDNGWTVTESQSGGLFGAYQASFQQDVAGTRNFFFLVGPGTGSLFLRNFDLDAPGGATAVTYIRPNATTVAGTMSANGVWNNGGTLNAGGDTIAGLQTVTGGAPDAGVWTFQISNWTAINQAVFEANTGAGQRLVLFDTPLTHAGDFTITPNTTRSAIIGTPVDHPFTVTNNFPTTDIINFTLSGTSANYTVQLLTSAGVPLTDTDGDGKLDTGILNPGQTASFILRVTPNAGAGPTDNTRVNATSFMDGKVSGAPVVSFVTKTTNLVSAASVSGLVYVDVNNDGTRQAGEPGIGSVTLKLTGNDTNGVAVNVTVTSAAGGAYSFANLLPSDATGYTITETQPSGYTDGLDAKNGVVIPGSNTTDVISGVVVAAGANAANNTFGEIGGTISGTVFADLNNDGVRQAGESGIGNVTLTLTGTDITGAAVNVTVTSAANGAYSFTGVRQSNAAGYTITETQPAGYRDGFDAKNGVVIAGSNATDTITAIVLAAGATAANNTFGEYGGTITKQLLDTSIDNGAGSSNDKNHAVIGELVNYSVQITVPQGTTPTLHIVDTLPAGLAYVGNIAPGITNSDSTHVSFTGSGTPTVTNNGQTVDFNLGSVTSTNTDSTLVETLTATYQAVVLNVAGNVNGTTLINSAIVSWNSGVNSAGPSSATAVTVIEPKLQTTDTVAVGGGGGNPGDTVTYTIKLQQDPASTTDAFNVTVADPLPKAGAGSSLILGPGFTVVDSAGSVTAANFQLVGSDATGWTLKSTAVGAFSLPEAPAGRTITITITGTLAGTATAGQVITNIDNTQWTSLPGANPGQISTFNANSTERTGNPANPGGALNNYFNNASAAFTVNSADLQVTKTVNQAAPNVGDTITYTVTLKNNGPNTATSVKLTDAVPAGLTLVTATPSQGTFVGSTWTVGTVNNGASVTLVLAAKVVSANAQTNTASVSSVDELDPNAANNSASVTETPQQADLAVTKTVNSSTPNVGDTITFTVTLADNGPNSATNVQVTDLLPAGLTFVSATPSQGSYVSGTGVWTVGTVTTTTSQSLQIQAKVVSPNAQTNTASVNRADQFDPNSANNSASVTETPQQADLAVTKTVNSSTPNVGDTITFTVTLADNGPNSATNVQLTDLLPAGLTFVSATPSQGSYVSGTGVWTVGTVTTTTSQSLQIQAKVVSPNAQTNTASVSRADQFDPNNANNSASVTETPRQADLAVTKTVNSSTPNVGDTITFTVTLADNGPNSATNVQVTDLLPAGLTFVSATPSQGSYVSGTGVWTVGTVTTTTSQSLQILGKVVSPNAQTNTASVSRADQFDPNSANNSASVTETPQQADLVVTKTVNSSTPNVGDTITFTVTLADNGPNSATNVQLTDLLPAGLTFVSATPSQGSYVSGTGVWTVGTVTTTTSQSLQIQAKVVSPNAQTNTASVSRADQFDPNSANNSASVTETPQQADLVITKTVNSSTPNVGDTITFTVTLADNGPNSATNVQVSDTLPAGLTFVSASPSQGSYNNGTGVWTVGSVSTAMPQTLQLLAKVVSPSAQTNTTSVSRADQYDPNPNNNSASASETPQQADLVVSKTVNNTTPNVGDTITFTISVSDAGPNAASNVTVQDALPAGLTFVSATLSQGSYNSATGLWTVGNVTTAFPRTLALVAQVTSPNPVINTASISHADQYDPDLSNNSASAPANPQQADLVVVKTVNSATPNVGDTIAFTITLSNTGPSAATNVQLQDVLPAGLTFVSSIASQGSYNSGTGIWTVGGVNNAANASLTISANVVSPNAQTNTASISRADQFDPNPGNNSSTATETPQQADLVVQKSINNATPNVGDTITFTVTLNDNGPNTASNVQVSDALPAGLTFVSASPSQGAYNNVTGLWSVGSVATTASQTLQIVARVVSPNAQTNSATISHADQFDPNSANNSASATETPLHSDLGLIKTVSNATPNVGDTISFTVTLSNAGPNTATNVVVHDLLPAGLTLVSAAPSQGVYNIGTGDWSVATLGNAASATLTISAKVVSPAAQTNSANITRADQYDPNPANNSASAGETPQQADLAVSKTVNNATPNVGDTITFTVQLSDLGPNTASNVQVSDLLPAGLSLVSATPSQGSYAGGTGVWTVGAVTTTTAQSLQILAKVVSANAQTNTASVSQADQFDPVSANNSANVTETPQQADLALTKTVNNATPNVGDTITFTVTLTDNGPNNASNVQVSDSLPAGLSFVSANPSQGAYNSGTGIWTVGAVGTTTPQTLQILAKVVSPNAQTNTASVSRADQFDPNPNNNTASATETPQQADLVLTKTVNNTTPNVGDTVTFTITLSDAGPNTATNVTVQDALPAGLTFVSATPSQGSYASATGTWTVGTVDTAFARTLSLVAQVTSANPAVNTATISRADQFDPNLNNNTASAPASPLQADLVVVKTVNNATPNVGDTITFTIALNNTGPSNATNVQLQDVLPAGLTFVASNASQGSYNSGTGIWTVGTVNNAANATLTLSAKVISPNAQTNTASISRADQFDPNPGNNSSTATETPQQADLVVQKTVNNPTPNVGDTITFTITLSDTGPNTATNVQVSDALPAGLTFVSAAASQGNYSSATSIWTVGSVTTAAAQTLQLVAKVVSPNAQTNTAAVSRADQFDPTAGNNGASATETPQQADLALGKIVSNATPNVGDTITFTVTLTDQGPNTATNTVVHDPLPAGLVLIAAAPSVGTYNNATGDWSVATLGNAASATLTISAKVVSPTAQTNSASITRADQFDPNSANNSASATETPQQADLALTKTVNNATPNVGDTITFTVTVTDNGPNNASNVQISDALPAGLSFVSANPSQGSYNNVTGLWSVGAVSTTTPQTLQLLAQVVSANAQINTASVSQVDQFDPVSANNSANVTETPQQADLALIKTVNNATPNVGDTITFTITVTDSGPNNASNVQVSDALPAGLSFVSANPSQGAYNSGTGIWTVGAVSTTTSQTLQILAKVISPNAQTNTASVSRADQFDPNANNNTASATETPQQADLVLTKTVNNTTPNVGDTITFTITLNDAGPNTATNVTVQDALPAGLTLVTATPSQGSYASATGTWTVGTVDTAFARTLSLVAQVTSANPVTNTASISRADQFDPNLNNNTASAPATPQEADLVVVKTVNNATPNVGDTVTFTITLSNTGPSNATSVLLQDVLPAGLTFVASNPSQGSYNSGTGVWTIGTVNNAANATLTLSALVVSPNAQTNTALITHADQFDPNPGNNNSSAIETPQQADLAVQKTVNDSVPNVGDTVTFTITLNDNGPNTASNVRVTDLLPAGLSFVSATPSQGSYNSGTGVWTVGSVDTLSARTLKLAAVVQVPGTITNTATVSHSDQFDPNSSNNSATSTISQQQADLGLSKIVSNATPNVGDTIIYTVTLNNQGPSTATNVVVHDLLPAGLLLVSAAPSLGTYDSGTGTWTVGTLNNSGSATLTISAKVASSAAQANTASIARADQFDPNPNNNSASITETPQQADLVVTKTVSNATPNVGDAITFTVSLTNIGSNTATNVQVTDLLPAGLNLVSATPSQGAYSSVTGVWTVGSVTTATPQSLQIVAGVVSPNGRTNTAAVSQADQFDPNSNNNSASVTETPQQADLAVSKSVNNLTPDVGDTVTFTVTLSDIGPNTASNVQVSDTLPAGLSFISANPSQGAYSNATGVWTVGSVTTATAQTLQILARVVSPNAQNNTAAVSRADQFDPNPGNNSASVTETPQQADLGLTKTVNNTTPNVGDTITFTITLSDAGPNTATNVTVQDALPPGLTFVSATPSQGSYASATGIWTVGTVNTAFARTLALVAQVTSPNPAVNVATISHADQFDPNPNNNTASAPATPQQADLVVVKTVDNPTPNVGDTVTFTVKVSNIGPNAATNVTLQDVLPSGLTLVSANPSQGSFNGGFGTWTVGILANAATATLTLSAKVVSPNAQTNTASVARADQFDPNPGNNSSSATETPQQADLAVTKTVNNAAPNVGDTITYTIAVADNGPNNASNVQISDLLPAGLSFVSANASQGAYSNLSGVWTVGNVATTTPQTLRILAKVVSPNAQSNTATVSRTDQFDPNNANNSATVTETPQQADLGVTKTVSSSTPNVGDTINFTVTLSNAGPNSATNIVLHDPLPAGLAFVSAAPSLGAYNSGTGDWSLATLANTASAILTLSAKVVSPAGQTNTATITRADQFDPNTANNSASAGETPQQADLALTKSVNNAGPNVGDTITFTVQLSDVGPSTATNVQVNDLLPAGLSLISATPSQGTYNGASGTWTIGTVTTAIPQTLQIVATVTSAAAQTNTASVTQADQYDPNSGNNSASVTETPQQADLAVSKTVSNATPNVGDTITFTVTLKDNGPNNASNVQVSDMLPAGLGFVSANPSQGTYNNGTGLWTVGSVSTTSSQTLQILAQVISPNTQANTATVARADQFDPNPNNNTASASETPQQADLGLTKTVDNAAPNVGDDITFTITLGDAGPNSASNVTVQDLLPAGLAFVSATPSQGTYTSGTGVWAVGAVDTLFARTLTLVAQVTSPNPAVNVATISHADQYDPNPNNNTATAPANPQEADVVVVKTVNNPTPNVGDTVTFTVTLSNIGPNNATNVSVSDLLPPGLTLVTSNASQGTYGGSVWSIGTINNATSATLTLAVVVVSASPQTNTATVAHADQFDPNPGNNSSSATETPQQADLSVQKTVSNASPNVGDTITFTVTLRDNGPNNASNVQVSDLLPAGLSFVSATPTQGTYNNTTGLWSVGTVSTTMPQTLQILARVVSPNAQTNTVSVSRADQFDPNSANNSANATEIPQQADLVVSKTVSNATPNVGDTITFTVTLGNAGPNTATNVVVHDPLPAGLALVSAAPSLGTYNSGTGDWSVATLGNGAGATLTLSANVVSPLAQVNTASVSHADQFDPNSANNSGSATETPQQADLAVSKTVNNATPNVGDTITFTVQLSDLGPNTATNVQVTDLLPAGLSLVSATPSQGAYSGGTGIWTVGTVTTTTSQSLQIVARVLGPSAQTNTASISHADQFDPNSANNSASVSESPQQADLAVIKTVSNSTPNVGDTVTFTVTLTDNGPSGATNVQVSDLLPAGLSFVSANPSQGAYSNVTGTWSIGSVSTTTAQTLQLLARVVSASAQTNTATIAHADQFDPNPNNNTANVTETPQQADLVLAKTVNNSTPNVGDVITFTITLSDAGPNSASNVTVQDSLPAGLAFLSATPSQGTYNNTTGLWTVGSVDTTTPRTLVVAAQVISPNPAVNTAAISHSDQFDPNPNNNTASAPASPQQADLVVVKTVNNAIPNIGDTITFTVTLSNTGPSAATNVTLQDLLPAGLNLVSANSSQGTYDGTFGGWTVGSVNNGANATLTLSATVVSPNAQTNTATVTHADQFDPNPGNNSSSATETPQQADLSVQKTVSNLTPNVGDTITFTVTLSDNGPNNASNVQISDLLPAGLSFVSATPTQGTYNNTTGLWNVGSVATTTPQTLQILARVVSPNAQTNTVSVRRADQFDPNSANNSANATEIPQQADLVVSKIVSNATPNVGDTITFTVTLSNAGPNTGTNVVVHDPLPAGLSLVSAAPSLGTYNSGTGDWSVATLGNGAGATLTLSAKVVSPSAQVNTAVITRADQFDPNSANNSASATETPQQADLAVTKTVNNATPNVGETITFTVQLSDLGPSTATNVQVTDLLPAGLSLLSATPSQGAYSSGTGIWTEGTVTTTTSQSLQIVARVASSSGQSNTATVSHADQFDPNSSNNSASAAETPEQADLAVTKTVNNATPNVGDTITFTVTLTDNGPSNASNVQLSDSLPAGLGFVSATPSQGTYNNATGLWSVGSVSTTTPQTLQIVATVLSPNAQTNSASVSQADQFDPNPGNNSANVTETPQQADLVVTKTVDNSTPIVGATITYTMTVSDAGPNTATTVVLQDVLPAGLTFVSATPSQGTYDNVSGLWTVGTVTTANAPSLQIVALVNGPVTVVNMVTVTHADQFDPNTANNTASAPTSSQQADLFVVKSIDNPTPNVGDTVTFTVTLGNTGPNTATNVRVQDILPPGLALVSSNASQGTYNSGSWTIGTLNNGASATLTLSARVLSVNPQTNTATVTHEDQFDPNPGNNSSSATETPQQADLAVTKTVSNATPNVGDTITFTVTLNDTGPSNASNVQVTDLLPAGLSFVSASSSQGAYNNVTGLWSVGTVATTTPETLQILARVVSPNARINAAAISHADQFDPNGTNDSASVGETPQQADLVVTKTVSNAAPNVGDTITYTVTLSNQGPGPATNAVVHDPLPAGLTLVSAAPSLGTYNSSTGDWSIVTLGNAASATLTLFAKVASSAAQVNTASITRVDQFDPNPGNNSASITETPQQADVTVAKAVSNATPHVGDNITYTLTVNNLGPDAATDVAANDLLPSGLTFVSSTASQGSYSSVTGAWFVGNIANQGRATLQIVATVTSTAAQTNSVQVGADQFDPNLSNNRSSVVETPASTLAGNVYIDVNNDGIRQAGEAGVGNVTLSLSGTNDLNQPVSVSITTAADGTYSFVNLRPGTYTITETPPAQFSDGKITPGSQGGAVGVHAIGNIALGSGVSGTGYNFGELGTTLSGEVFVDSNRNGVLDSGEAGMSGVTITLDDPSGNALASTATSVSGVYTFANLPSGNYHIVETAPNGYGTSTPTTLVVTLPLTGLTGQNFGVTTGVLSGSVYADANDNGRRDPGEAGIAGIAVTLTGRDVTGRAATQIVTTAGDGSYQFTGVVGGSYTITEGPVAGFLQGINSVGTVNGAPNGVLGPGPNVISSINLPGGSQGINYNFAELTVAASSGIETAIVIPGVPAPQVSVSNFGKYLLLGSSAASLVANITYVNGVYHELLQRAPDQGGIDTWVYWLQTGALSRLAVAAAVDHSAEHRGLQVDHFYQLFLNRQADPAGRAGWVNYLAGGGSEYALAVSFLTSAEYTASHGSNAAFLTGLYMEVLARTPDAGGMAGWLAQLQGGASRAAVANAFLTSTEAYRRIVDQSYIEYLRRQADPAGEQGFVAALQNGSWAPESIAELFLASDEFYQNPH